MGNEWMNGKVGTIERVTNKTEIQTAKKLSKRQQKKPLKMNLSFACIGTFYLTSDISFSFNQRLENEFSYILVNPCNSNKGKFWPIMGDNQVEFRM